MHIDPTRVEFAQWGRPRVLEERRAYIEHAVAEELVALASEIAGHLYSCYSGGTGGLVSVPVGPSVLDRSRKGAGGHIRRLDGVNSYRPDLGDDLAGFDQTFAVVSAALFLGHAVL